MISPQLRFDQLDAEEWQRLLRLLRPQPSARGPTRSETAGSPLPLVLLLESSGGVTQTIGVLRVPLDGGRPRKEDPAAYPWSGPASLGAHRRRVGARIAAAVDVAAIGRIIDQSDRDLRVGDDLVAQLLATLRAARAELGRGVLLDPDPFSPIPIPSFAALQQTLDLLLPDDRAAGLFVYERGRLYTSVVVEKRGGHIVRVTSARALGQLDPGRLPQDFRDGRHRAVLDAMTRSGLRPHMVGFLTRAAVAGVLSPQPGSLAQSVALREAVLDPAPPFLVALAGAGAVAGVAQTAGKLFGRFVPQGIKDSARGAMQSASGMGPFAALGFDPVQLFTDLMKLF